MLRATAVTAEVKETGGISTSYSACERRVYDTSKGETDYEPARPQYNVNVLQVNNHIDTVIVNWLRDKQPHVFAFQKFIFPQKG